MNKLIGLFFIMVSLPLSADFDNKCSVLITLRFQSNDCLLYTSDAADDL